MLEQDTIAAIATAPGYGAVGIVRVSGPAVVTVAESVLGELPSPRVARFARFRGDDDTMIDEGIALYFPAPASFTGEDVLELQGHGGPVVMQLLLERVIACGARAARPGEFSERAFLNGKLDLTRAEAVADLIASGSARAARSAANSLRGVFADRVNVVVDQLVAVRVALEAAFDFPDEEIPATVLDEHRRALQTLTASLRALAGEAETGARILEGLRVVLVGLPNVGKSSLLNMLAREGRAIVAATPGTTRDVLREQILIAGLPITVVDTAGHRTGGDAVESEGMRRAVAEIGLADRLVLVTEYGRSLGAEEEALCARRAAGAGLIVVRNKTDLHGAPPARRTTGDVVEIDLSALTGAGLELLEQELAGAPEAAPDTGAFSARRRHVEALEKAAGNVDAALAELDAAGPELVAELLRLAQLTLAGITGDFSADDLLGEIFSRFCIGK